MTHSQDLVDRLAEEGRHSKRLQTIFFRKTERPGEKLTFDEQKSTMSQKGRALEHQESRHV